jgi:hypothetical protein
MGLYMGGRQIFETSQEVHKREVRVVFIMFLLFDSIDSMGVS